MVFLEPLPGDGISAAVGINSSGLAVGWSNNPGLEAVYWVGTRAISLQPQLPLGPNSRALDVNDRNQICGWMGGNGIPHLIYPSSPFIWQEGKTTTLPLPGYAAENTGVATALNNLGDACGYFFIDDLNSEGYFRRACAWIDGELIDLGVLPGTDGSHALDISDAREIVGYCMSGPNGNIRTPFLWRDGVMMNLDDLLPDGMFTSAQGHAINNAGQIAGEGRIPEPNGYWVALRLTPALPLVPGDTNCSASVDVDDLVNVILDWNPQGPVGGNPTDLNRDNRIDILDLIEVILRWSVK